MNVLIVGHGGCFNRGCEALLHTTMQILRDQEPSCKFTVLTMKYDYDVQRVPAWGFDCEVVTFYPPRNLSWLLRGGLRKVLGERVWPHSIAGNKRHFQQADVVVAIGGDNLSGEAEWNSLFAGLMEYPTRLGRPVALSAASVGKYHDPVDEARCRELLKSLSLVTVRETKTLEYLNSLGVRENLHLVGDPAFTLKPQRTDRNRFPELDVDRMKVGLGPSSLMSRIGQLDEKSYIEATADFCAHLAAEHNALVVLVPHVTDTRPERDDFAVALKVRQAVGDRADMILLGSELSGPEMKDVIGRCDYFVGARTHSTVAAFSSLVPVISVGYSVKAEGLNRDLLGHERYVVPIAGLSFEVLRDRFRELMNDRDNVVSRLRTAVPQMQERARLNGKLIIEAARTRGK